MENHMLDANVVGGAGASSESARTPKRSRDTGTEEEEPSVKRAVAGNALGDAVAAQAAAAAPTVPNLSPYRSPLGLGLGMPDELFGGGFEAAHAFHSGGGGGMGGMGGMGGGGGGGGGGGDGGGGFHQQLNGLYSDDDDDDAVSEADTVDIPAPRNRSRRPKKRSKQPKSFAQLAAAARRRQEHETLWAEEQAAAQVAPRLERAARPQPYGRFGRCFQLGLLPEAAAAAAVAAARWAEGARRCRRVTSGC